MLRPGPKSFPAGRLLQSQPCLLPSVNGHLNVVEIFGTEFFDENSTRPQQAAKISGAISLSSLDD